MNELHTLIINKSKHKRIVKNSILLYEGEICNKFVYLEKGIIRHYFTDKKGNDITKNFIKAPAYFCYSLSSFVSQTPGIIQCETLSEVELWEIKYENFQEMMRNLDFLNFWNNMLSSFILKKEKKEIALLRDSATQRYLQFLENFPGVLNEIPHYYIASYLSISPETLSRIRKSIS